MTTNPLKKVFGIAAVITLGASAPAWAKDPEARVIYQGDRLAEDVCMSIVRDDVDALQSAFRHGRRLAFREGRVSPVDRSHLSYECNDLRLDEFAFTQNAQEVQGYLAPLYPRQGTVTVEQIGSIGQ